MLRYVSTGLCHAQESQLIRIGQGALAIYRVSLGVPWQKRLPPSLGCKYRIIDNELLRACTDGQGVQVRIRHIVSVQDDQYIQFRIRPARIMPFLPTPHATVL